MDQRWFAEATTCAAGNLVSFATGTSDEHQALQLGVGGWVLWDWSDGSEAPATKASLEPEAARVWLLRNEHFDAAAGLASGGDPSAPR